MITSSALGATQIQRLLLGAETDVDPPRGALQRVPRQTPLVQLFFLVCRIVIYNLKFIACSTTSSSPRGQ